MRDAFLQSIGIGPGHIPPPAPPVVGTPGGASQGSGDVDVVVSGPASDARAAPIRFLDLVKHSPEDFVVNEIDWAGQVVSVARDG